jgi:hypothetical protein
MPSSTQILSNETAVSAMIIFFQIDPIFLARERLTLRASLSPLRLIAAVTISTVADDHSCVENSYNELQ